MRKLKRYLLLQLLIIGFMASATSNPNQLLFEGSSAVTYKLNGGRFGDNLSSYCRAKWLSLKNDIPLLYQPFDHSDQLIMHERELKINKKIEKQFSNKITIPGNKQYIIEKSAGILYEHVWQSHVPVNWRDQEFLNEIKKCIAPLYLKQDFVMPTDCVTVAVHIRTPGWFYVDRGRDILNHPLKYVTYDYYREQIKRIATMFPDKKLYVHIFTDHERPHELVNFFKKEINNECITYGYRKKGNNWRSYVVEDFFAMVQCDCLIRNKSMFSIYAERLGDHKVVIYPKHAIRKGNLHQVKKVVVKTYTQEGYKTETLDAKCNASFILITTLYNETNSKRRQEFITCIDHNCAHPLIETVHVLYDTAKDNDANILLDYLKSKDVVITYVEGRPTYGMCFYIANQRYPNKKIIVCNGDIYFNDTLQYLIDYDLTGKFLALTRWEEWSDGSISPYHRGQKGRRRFGRETRDSQDAWIFQTPLRTFVKDDIRMGLPLCDCRIAYHAKEVGLHVFNPCRTIQCIHVHRSGNRSYTHQDLRKVCNEPYITLCWCALK